MRNFCLLAVTVAVLWWLFSPADSTGVLQPDGSLRYPGYEFSNAERFELEGRVLSRRNYSSGREAELSPVDLAMGWGRMTEDAVIERLEISQRNRWYKYRWGADGPPLPPAEISSQSANMHLVPANEQVATELATVRAGDRVKLYGDLVDIAAADGWRWRSSRSRTDTGAGACELILIERIDLL